MVPTLSLFPRPLASTVNDKLELQECLEHGRIAKVSPGRWDAAGGSGDGVVEGGGGVQRSSLVRSHTFWGGVPSGWRRDTATAPVPRDGSHPCL